MNPNLVLESESFTRTSLKIPSVVPSWNLDAWCYLSRMGQSPFPVIVMAHGLSANKLLGIAPYAQAFASAGYACVVFDYRRWGASDGTPRHCVNIAEQLEDYRTVVKYCRQQEEFDPQKVILWGSSLSGGHVATLAAEMNLNLSAVVAQCAWLGVGASPSLSVPFIKLLTYAYLDILKQAIGLSPLYIPAGGLPGEVAALTTPGSLEGLKGLAYDDRDYPNELSASSVLEMGTHRAVLHAANVTCPVLLVTADRDNICLLKGALDYAHECPSAENFRIDCGHFDIYPKEKYHKEALDAELSFLKRVVPV